MLENIRLVILDYPKLMIRDENVKKILADMIQAKQINFERSNENYIPLSGLDMISTHCLVYDVSTLYGPKLISTIRVSYQERCKTHRLKLPVENSSAHFPDEVKAKFLSFQKKHPNLADCGSMFIDEEWSKKKRSVVVLELALLLMYSYLLRLKQTHMLATTNQNYAVSKILRRTGDFETSNIFTHPEVPVPHLLVLMEQFNFDWIYKSFNQFENLYKNKLEFIPEKIQQCLLDEKELKYLVSSNHNFSETFRELDLKSGKLIAS